MVDRTVVVVVEVAAAAMVVADVPSPKFYIMSLRDSAGVGGDVSLCTDGRTVLVLGFDAEVTTGNETNQRRRDRSSQSCLKS